MKQMQGEREREMKKEKKKNKKRKKKKQEEGEEEGISQLSVRVAECGSVVCFHCYQE